MSTTFSATNQANYSGHQSKYISSFESLFEGNPASLEWLIIAHPDQAAAAAISQVIDHHDAAIMQIPQVDWELGGSKLRALIETAVAQGTKHILLVGHSDGAPAQPARWLGDGLDKNVTEPSDSGYQRLLGGAACTNRKTAAGKQHFAEQIGALLESPEIQRAAEAGQLQIHALFYLAVSGTFLTFDFLQQEFVPLAA